MASSTKRLRSFSWHGDTVCPVLPLPSITISNYSLNLPNLLPPTNRHMIQAKPIMGTLMLWFLVNIPKASTGIRWISPSPNDPFLVVFRCEIRQFLFLEPMPKINLQPINTFFLLVHSILSVEAGKRAGPEPVVKPLVWNMLVFSWISPREESPVVKIPVWNLLGE